MGTGFHLWQSTLRWQRALAEKLAPLGLTHGQFFLLDALRGLLRHGVRPQQRAVAEAAGLDPMTASQVLRALEGRGLVARQRDPSDARARRLNLTAAGQRVHRRAANALAAVDRAFFRPAGQTLASAPEKLAMPPE